MANSLARVPFALTKAHSDLVGALQSGIKQFKTNLRYSNSGEVCQCIERFVGELCRVPQGANELETRKTLVSVRCKQGTAFRKLMDQAFKCLKNTARKKSLGPGLSAAKLAAWQLKPKSDLQFESLLRETIDAIKGAERENVLPIRCRKAFRVWADECRQIASDAQHVEADGCFFLSSVYHASDSNATKMDAAAKAVLGIDFGGANLESIKAAADSLLDWVIRRAAPQVNTVHPKRKPTKTVSRRGGSSTLERDLKLWEEYEQGLDDGKWTTKTDFGKEKNMHRSTVSKALKRAEAAKRELTQKPAKRSR